MMMADSCVLEDINHLLGGSENLVKPGWLEALQPPPPPNANLYALTYDAAQPRGMQAQYRAALNSPGGSE